MDWINVMTYDFTGDWTNYAGHHSPLFASSKQPGGTPRSTELTMKYLLEERGFPPTGWRWGSRSTAGLRGRGTLRIDKRRRQDRAFPQGNYSNLHKLLQEQGWTRHWDDETKNPWLISPDRSMVIGYDDAESVALKTDWAMKQGFRGVFFWQVAADRLPDGTNPLQEASRKVWDEDRRRQRQEALTAPTTTAAACGPGSSRRWARRRVTSPARRSCRLLARVCAGRSGRPCRSVPNPGRPR